MKGKRWFFVLLLILLLINVAVFIVLRYTHYNAFIKEKLIGLIEANFGIGISIENIDISDRQIKITGINLQSRLLEPESTPDDNHYSLSVAQIYINYSLFKALFSNIKLFKSFESVTIIEPSFSLVMNREGTGDKERSFESIEDFLKKLIIPDVSGFFNILTLTDGSISFSYSGNNVSFSDTLSSVFVEIVNDKTTRMKITAGSIAQPRSQTAIQPHNPAVSQETVIGIVSEPSNNGSLPVQMTSPATHTDEILSVSLEAVKDKIVRVNVEVRDYHLSGLKLPGAEGLSLNLDFSGRIVSEKEPEKMAERFLLSDYSLNYRAALRNGSVSVNGYKASTPMISLQGGENLLTIETDNLLIDNNRADLQATLTDYLTGIPFISGKLNLKGVRTNRYLSFVRGIANAKISFEGIISSPDIKLTAGGRKFQLYGEELTNVIVSASYFPELIPISLDSAVWQGNLLKGEGQYSDSAGFVFQVHHNGLQFEKSGVTISADTRTSVVYQNELQVNSFWDKVSVSGTGFKLNNLSLNTFIDNRQLKIEGTGNRLDFSLAGDVVQKDYHFLSTFRRFNLNDVLTVKVPTLPAYPHIAGQIEGSLRDGTFSAKTGLRMSNPHAGYLDGGVSSEIVYNSLSDSAFVKLTTSGASYNFEPFQLDLLAGGRLDDLQTEKLAINNDVYIRLNLQGLGRSFVNDRDSGLSYDIEVTSNEIPLRNYLKYLLPYHTANRFSGTSRLELKYNGNLKGSIKVDNFGFDDFSGYSNLLTFHTGTLSQNIAEKNIPVLFYSNTVTGDNENLLMTVSGTTNLAGSYDTKISAVISEVPISSLLLNNEIKGTLTSAFLYHKKNGSLLAELSLKAEQVAIPSQNNTISYGGFADIDLLEFSVQQNDTLLTLVKFNSYKQGDFSLQASGSLNYNIFENITYTGDDAVSVKFSGDLLKLLADSFAIFDRGVSDAEAEFKVSVREEELSVTEGSFTLKNGELMVKNQLIPISNITIDMHIENNRLEMTRCEGKMGEGWVLVRNLIENEETDFRFGMLNLGKFFVRTTGGGIAVHLPKIFPQGTAGTVVIRGRDASEGVISGPFDDIKIVADCYVSNASILFPANTDNLFKIINIAAERRTSSIRVPIPFTLDLMLYTDQQVRYVTYPLNLLINPDGYLHLLYIAGSWIPKESFLSSDSGYLDLFGTTFSADYANLIINYELNDYRLRGYFFKYAADGSIITLSIYNDSDVGKEDFLNNLNFNIESDNPEDRTILHVLSKVRYNRRLEDIPRSQQNALLQDEFLQFAGMGLTGAFVDPFISPIENSFRRMLRLDYFSINPGFLENIVRTYGYSEKDYELEKENEIVHFGKNILLNNLSVTMGKFIARDTYLDYEFLLQKPLDVVGTADLLVYHNFTLYYNLPFRMRLAYRFYLKPENEKNEHEIFVRRGFSFW